MFFDVIVNKQICREVYEMSIPPVPTSTRTDSKLSFRHVFQCRKLPAAAEKRYVGGEKLSGNRLWHCGRNYHHHDHPHRHHDVVQDPKEVRPIRRAESSCKLAFPYVCSRGRAAHRRGAAPAA
jgi:hypothetical protein